MKRFMLFALTLLGGVLGMIAGALAPVGEEDVWERYLHVPSAHRPLATTDSGIVVLGVNGRVYACFEPDGRCQPGVVPDADADPWDHICTRTPFDTDPSPPLVAPPQPPKAMLSDAVCGNHGSIEIYYALMEDGWIWTWHERLGWRDGSIRIDNAVAGALGGAAGGFGLAVLLPLVLWAIGRRRPVAAAPPPPAESPPGAQPPASGS